MRDRIAKTLSRLFFFFFLPLPETALRADDTSNQPPAPRAAERPPEPPPARFPIPAGLGRGRTAPGPAPAPAPPPLQKRPPEHSLPPRCCPSQRSVRGEREPELRRSPAHGGRPGHALLPAARLRSPVAGGRGKVPPREAGECRGGAGAVRPTCAAALGGCGCAGARPGVPRLFCAVSAGQAVAGGHSPPRFSAPWSGTRPRGSRGRAGAAVPGAPRGRLRS